MAGLDEVLFPCGAAVRRPGTGVLDHPRETRRCRRPGEPSFTSSTVAAVQDGLLLAETSRDSELLRLGFDTAIAELHAHAPAAA